ncbi:MAG: TolC family protein, partial [Bacteroidota bacterium]|nr:TolC family protein [Bacteroidota bacterium]
AIPDVTMSAGWDKSGGYVKNYNSVGMQIDLPFFNRNQGGIKAAKMDLEGSKVDLLSAGDKVKAEVIQAYAVLNENNSLFRKFDKKYIEDMDGLMNEIVKNFTCKNISLIEFLNYYDAYKQNKIQFNTLQYNRINALENLNFSVGKDLLIQN